MARPRTHAPDALLDAAEELLVGDGRAALTVRSLAARAGASNGSIYHAFGSLETVVASAWLRRAEQFLEVQRAVIASAGDAREAVRAAADAPAQLAERDLRAARLLVGLRHEDVLVDSVAAPVAERLRALEGDLTGTVRELARRLAVPADLVTTCVVRLPSALLFPEIRAGGVRPITRRRLAAAVGAVLDCTPTPQEEPECPPSTAPATSSSSTSATRRTASTPTG
ncbi:UNVERIFIED_ORG: TetR/AcrR family transcriptional regulator [Bacillus sp. AZ43]